jgi:hypothetical protein
MIYVADSLKIRRKRRRTALDPLLSLCKDSESSETIEAATSGPIETGSGMFLLYRLQLSLKLLLQNP